MQKPMNWSGSMQHKKCENTYFAQNPGSFLSTPSSLSYCDFPLLLPSIARTQQVVSSHTHCVEPEALLCHCPFLFIRSISFVADKQLVVITWLGGTREFGLCASQGEVNT